MKTWPGTIPSREASLPILAWVREPLLCVPTTDTSCHGLYKRWLLGCIPLLTCGLQVKRQCLLYSSFCSVSSTVLGTQEVLEFSQRLLEECGMRTPDRENHSNSGWIWDVWRRIFASVRTLTASKYPGPSQFFIAKIKWSKIIMTIKLKDGHMKSIKMSLCEHFQHDMNTTLILL